MGIENNNESASDDNKYEFATRAIHASQSPTNWYIYVLDTFHEYINYS